MHVAMALVTFAETKVTRRRRNNNVKERRISGRTPISSRRRRQKKKMVARDDAHGCASVAGGRTPGATRIVRRIRFVRTTKRKKRKWWPGTELNCRHRDFQSPALPTELPGHTYCFLDIPVVVVWLCLPPARPSLSGRSRGKR